MDKLKSIRMNTVLAEQIYRASFAQKRNAEVVGLLLQRFCAVSYPGDTLGPVLKAFPVWWVKSRWAFPTTCAKAEVCRGYSKGESLEGSRSCIRSCSNAQQVLVVLEGSPSPGGGNGLLGVPGSRLYIAPPPLKKAL